MVPTFPARSYAFCEYVRARNWIGGAWVEAAGGQSIPVENPRHGKAMSSVVMSGPADVEAAVAAADAAWKMWRHTPVKERGEVFYRLKYQIGRAHV